MSPVTTLLDIERAGPLLEVSVVMPCFNQSSSIRSVVGALAANLQLPFELILIDDSSSDRTADELLLAVKDVLPSTVCRRARVLRTNASLFETGCDNLGFSLAGGAYLLEVQADMTLFDPGFDRRMVAALKRYDDLLMVSGRGTECLKPVARWYANTLGAVSANTTSWKRYACSRLRHRFRTWIHRSESFETNMTAAACEASTVELGRIFPSNEDFAKSGEAGRLGDLVERVIPAGKWPTNRIWLGETVMRGPLMIDRSRLDRAGGLDSGRFFLGFDDHDLAYRAYRDCGLRCGFVPVKFTSPLAAGSTRKNKSWAAELSMANHLLRIRSRRSSAALLEVVKGPRVNLPRYETRVVE